MIYSQVDSRYLMIERCLARMSVGLHLEVSREVSRLLRWQRQGDDQRQIRET